MADLKAGITREEIIQFREEVKVGSVLNVLGTDPTQGDSSTHRSQMTVIAKYRNICLLASKKGNRTTYTWKELYLQNSPKFTGNTTTENSSEEIFMEEAFNRERYCG